MKSRKGRKHLLSVLIVAICTSICCECDDTSTTVESEINVSGTWILKSAEFQEDDVDLDGEGAMLPMKNIKYFLLDLFNVYANCSSIDEIPIQFSNEVAVQGVSGNPTKYHVKAVCPENQGITASFATYYLNPESRTSFVLEIDELNDPGGLINWEEGFLVMFVTDESGSGGVRTLFGFSTLRSSNSQYHRFNWVLEEYVEI